MCITRVPFTRALKFENGAKASPQHLYTVMTRGTEEKKINKKFSSTIFLRFDTPPTCNFDNLYETRRLEDKYSLYEFLKYFLLIFLTVSDYFLPRCRSGTGLAGFVLNFQTGYNGCSIYRPLLYNIASCTQASLR